MSVALGLPKGLLASPEIALSAGCESRLVRVQPNNVNSISSSTQSLPLTSGYTNSLVFPSQLIQFSIPCGMGGKNVWIDSEKSTISYRVNYSVKSASTQAAGNGYTANTQAYLQESAASWISRIVHIGPNGQTLTTSLGSVYPKDMLVECF